MARKKSVPTIEDSKNFVRSFSRTILRVRSSKEEIEEHLEQKAILSMASVPKLDSISYAEIKDIIDEYNHQLFHLERSQTELKLAIEEDPEENEFKIAFEENVVVIARRRNILEVMINYLKENDPTFDHTTIKIYQKSQENNLNQPPLEIGVTSNTTAARQGPILVEEDDQDEDDRGMHI